MKSLLVLSFLVLASCMPEVDSGQEVLYKEDYAAKLLEYQSFPMSSWSYLVTTPNYKIPTKGLDTIERSFPVILDAENPRGMGRLLNDWILDGVFLDKAPEDIDEGFAAAVSKAQFLEMFNPGGLKYIQNDPFGRSEKFMSIWSEGFALLEGDTEAKYKFTPVLSKNLVGKKSEVKWGEIETLLKESKSELKIVGTEYFTRANKLVIMKDLKKLGLQGGILLALLLIGLVYFSLYKVLFFLPLIGGAMYLAIWLFAGIEGSIHGLVLSFGTSIVGLSMDYAIHAVHAKDKKKLWRKNLIALLTTVFAFVCLSFSSLPLFRGIAVFAVLGLSLSFVIMWAFDKKFQLYQEKSILSLSGVGLPNKWIYSIFVLLPLVALTVSYNKSLKPFLYVPPTVEDVMEELSKNQGEVLVKVSDFSENRKVISESQFGLNSFTKNVDQTQRNLNSKAWSQSLSKFDETKYNGFFKDFLDKMKKRSREAFSLKRSFYSSLFLSGDREVEFWKTSGEQDKKIAKKEGFWSPKHLADEMGGASLVELVKLFSAAVILAFLALFFVFKDIFKVIAVFFPFAFSVFSFLILSLFIGFQVNIVHIIGLLIVFGISLDYGVFGAEASGKEKEETLSAFCLSGLTTFLGFAPLALVVHPVLQSLGTVLVVGVVCSFIAGVVLLDRGES